MLQEFRRFFLNNWRDGLSIGSFVVTLGGFAIAIWQIRRTKRAADAARESAENILKESNVRFFQYSFTNLNHYETEVLEAISRAEWKIAKI